MEQYSPLGDATRGLPIGEHIPLQTEVAVDHEGKVLDKGKYMCDSFNSLRLIFD